MDDIVPTIIDAATGSPRVVGKRQLAEAMAQKAGEEKYMFPLLAKLPYRDALAAILWNAATEGKIQFADGRELLIDDARDWLEIVKFMSQHVDGGASQNDVPLNQLNIFKIYAGFDPEDV